MLHENLNKYKKKDTLLVYSPAKWIFPTGSLKWFCKYNVYCRQQQIQRGWGNVWLLKFLLPHLTPNLDLHPHSPHILNYKFLWVSLDPTRMLLKKYHICVLLEGFLNHEGSVAELISLPSLHHHAFKLVPKH